MHYSETRNFRAFSSDTREILGVCLIHLSIQFSDKTSDLSHGKSGYRMFSRRDLEYVDLLCLKKISSKEGKEKFKGKRHFSVILKGIMYVFGLFLFVSNIIDMFIYT